MQRRTWNLGGVGRQLAAIGLASLAFAAFSAIRLSAANAADPFPTRIDQLVEAAGPGVLAPMANDAEWVRRVHLDLTGRVPTAAETRAFLDDPSPEKRTALVDRLLASPQFPQRMADAFDVMLMERRPDMRVPAADWRKYLVESFAANKPWDQLTREILSADGVDPALRPAAKFYLDRDGEPNLLTRDVSRVFFGMDLQCAQCHDHPLIDDYLQSDYYGIYAFLNRGFIFTDKKDAKQVFYAEKADGEAKFSSVFTKEAGQSGPHVPGGEFVVEPVFAKGEEYTVAPADNVRPVPKYSRRLELAKQATNGSSRQYARNIANRLWALLLGRGIVEPVDLHHSSNPPAHPELLELLTDEIIAVKFDMRAFLRGVALSRTYQRAYDLPEGPMDVAAATQQVTTLEAEQKRLDAVAAEAAAAWTKATNDRDAVEKTLLPLHDEHEKAQAAESKAFEASTKAAAALAAAQQNLAVKQDVANTLAAAAAKTTEAAKKLPDDKELAAAAEKFTAKSTAVAAEAATLTKTAADLMPPAKAAADALAASRAATQAAYAKIAAARAQVDPLRKQAMELEKKCRAAQYAASQATARLLDAKLLVQTNSVVAAVQSGSAAVAKSQADLQANKDLVQKLATELPQMQTAMAEAAKVREEAAKQLADAQQQMNTMADLAKTLAEASVQAEAAKQKLANDAEVAAAAASVKARSDKAAADLEPLKKLVADRTPIANAAVEKFNAAQQTLTAMQSQMTAAQQQTPTLETAVKAAGDKLAADQLALQNVRQEWASRWSQRFYASVLRPLTPEQMAWSVMQVSGVVAAHRAAAEAEIAKTTPLTDAIKADPVQMAARERQIEQWVQDKLRGNVGTFVSLFGGGAGQNQTDFYATVDQALFFSNGGAVLSWLSPSGENLTGRLLKLDNAQAIADELYLSVFARRPTAQEVAEVGQYLAGRPNDKPVALQEMAWALVTSSEFRFNH
ncbi:MAG: DUF1549 domain-containing protein [Pirellulales bacterium]